MQRRRVLRVLVNHEPIDRPRSSQISSIRGKKNDKIAVALSGKKLFHLIRINRFETEKISRNGTERLYDCEF